MRSLSEILEEVQGRLAAACARAGRRADDVEIVAVTKTHGPETVAEAWQAGLGIVGENKVQEGAWKRAAAPGGPSWHLIGHLQKNKVRPALETFDFFHAVDSIDLLRRMDAIAGELGLSPHVLLEVNVSGERTKNGLAPDAVEAALAYAFASCPRVTVEGFMTMAPFFPPDQIERTRPFFADLRLLRDRMEQAMGARFPRLSMGMSNDYAIAVEEGATWVRLGTVLFGERPKMARMRSVDAGDAGESGEGGGLYDRVLD